MKTVGTDGRTYIINPSRDSKEIDDNCRSKLHLKARSVIKKCLPYNSCYEEVLLLGCRGPGGPLTADFLIPEIPMIIEVHGEQHYKFSEFFHKTKKDFKEHILRDEIKKDWAELNNIIFVELPFDKQKEWKKIINGHIN